MELTPDVFRAQCKPRFGRTNPERMHLPYWEWMIRTERDPFSVRKELGLESNFPKCDPHNQIQHGGPDWCFKRFGRTRTRMPDGRVICIAGEHEDYYDPDFCIYNDVVVLRPEPGQNGVSPDSGEVEIYGYPELVFPPTDFHSATLVERKIFIIGRLGYPSSRREGETPISSLDLATHRIERIDARGPAPGWIYTHSAWYEPKQHAIVVRGGKVWRPKVKRETPNHAVHRLHLAEMRWECIAERETHRYFVIRRKGQERQAAAPEEFRPTVSHEWIDLDDREIPTSQFVVEGVRITLDHWASEIEIWVEGELSPDTRDLILSELTDYLCEKTECVWAIEETPESEMPSKRRRNAMFDV
jgi:hypothetical protein